MTKTNRESQNETGKRVITYKTKEVYFFGRKTRIILQNENGPCPLIAICNVLLLRNKMKLYANCFQVSQDKLLSLVADVLFEATSGVDSYDDEYIKNLSDAIDLLQRFADGINVNIRFRSIDDFELTPELAIFQSLKIPLCHGWIVDNEDFQTATAIGCKSYNDLMTGLVTLETQARSCQIERSIDFTATLEVPSQRCSKTSSFADSTPTSAEHGRLRRGDVEEEIVLLRALKLSEREKLGFDTCRDSSSGGESVSEDDTLLDSVDTITPGSSNICHQSKCDDQFFSKESEDETDFDVGEVVCSATSITKSSGALDHGQLSSTELGDDTVCEVETEKSSKTNALHVTSSDTISAEKANLESIKIDSSSEIPLKSEAVTSINPDLSGSSQDDDKPRYEAECVSLGSPVIEERDTNGLTSEDGKLIKNFLSNNLSQLTDIGIYYLQEELIEGELCVFFRNNHFYTMLKHDNALYTLVTDEGYLNERDVVWEKLYQVSGDSVFVNGEFKVFNCDSGKWDQQSAVSNTADYIFGINSSSKEGMEIDPDLKMAMELQQQELSGGSIDFECVISLQVPIRSSHMSSSIQEVKTVQRWPMYSHVYRSSSCLLLCRV
ncbi:ubiquitin carboxyl-terminal hydrolase MINDY-1 [Eutrema salsugineum]|uniref:ubiquitin carboxyl-terminal hydrolase MINDY-1 n=1 Tax=Eutrema salsugineum TaxID=72664 RepID=UPI000CED6AF4|nr:ubiquitin carboxyl-terminal hydrolase MINDY-1 [Eutrema salsugineum]